MYCRLAKPHTHTHTHVARYMLLAVRTGGRVAWRDGDGRALICAASSSSLCSASRRADVMTDRCSTSSSGRSSRARGPGCVHGSVSPTATNCYKLTIIKVRFACPHINPPPLPFVPTRPPRAQLDRIRLYRSFVRPSAPATA